MKLLLDTHLLLWMAGPAELLPPKTKAMLQDPDNSITFSVINIWETAIKHSLGRADFVVDPAALRRNLIAQGFTELPATGEHALAVMHLPPIHRDPFDRLLIAQAKVEGLTLLTADKALARYGNPVLFEK